MEEGMVVNASLGKESKPSCKHPGASEDSMYLQRDNFTTVF